MKTLSTKMKISGLTLIKLLITVALLADIHQAVAQGSRFFRISGPAATKIMVLRTDGSLVWSNALAGTNYTVQTVAALPGGTNWVDYVQLPISQSVNTNQIVSFNAPAGMAFIPAGSFTMGDTLSGYDAPPPTNVYVSAFYMDKNLVSYHQWQAVCAYAESCGYFFYGGLGKATNQPVHTVSWYDCVKWCNARSQKEGLTPVYYTDIALTQVYAGFDYSDTVYPNWDANGYRLPTDAEWEKAARGGLVGQRYPWGNTISETQANYYGSTNDFAYDLGPDGYNVIGSVGETSPATSPVGSFAPNNYGLYDMAGNLDQWCWDLYDDPYSGGIDPHGPASSNYNSRVLRGGDWLNSAFYARCASRRGDASPNEFYSTYGFRCVMRY
jgi:formylglycine-generating enzyme required for sulfatase activity